MQFRVLGLNEDCNHASCVPVAGIPADADCAQSVRAVVIEFGASFDYVRPRGGLVKTALRRGPADGPPRLGVVAARLCSLACTQLLLTLGGAKQVTLLPKLLVCGGTLQE